VNIGLTGPGGSMAAALAMMQAGAAIVHAGGAGVFIDNSGVAQPGGFDPRAGIDGPGRVLAATPVALQLVGAHVVGGDRLALPSFRVGQGGVSTQFVVSRDAAEGPVVRAAVQAVGAVDPALSGTAYDGAATGPIGPGQSAGPHTVRFNPVVGQALDGQALQVVSNFGNVGSVQLAVTGQAYSPAVAAVDANRIDLGIVRVGDAMPVRALTLANTAPGTLTDVLHGKLSGAEGAFNAAGETAAIAAGSADSTSLTVTLDTRQSGAFSGAAVLGLTSRNPDLPDLALAAQLIELRARVHAPAFATLSLAGGTGQLSGGNASYWLDFGTLMLGQPAATAELTLRNGAVGVADDLAGMFDLSALAQPDWLLTGFTGFTGLAAGSPSPLLQVALQPMAVGRLSGTIRLATQSVNGFGPDLALPGIELHLTANVAAVPEPGTWALWLAGLAGLSLGARRRVPASRVAVDTI